LWGIVGLYGNVKDLYLPLVEKYGVPS